MKFDFEFVPTSIRLPSQEEVTLLTSEFSRQSRDFADALARFGSVSLALRRYGLTLWASGNLEQAARSLLAAVSADPKDGLCWSDLAGIHSATDNSVMVAYCARQSLQIDETRLQPWLLLASALDKMKRNELALQAYKHAATLEPSSAAAHFGMGMAHLRQSDIPMALAALTRAVDIDPSNAFAWLCLGHGYYGIGDFKNCLKSLGAARDISSIDRASRFIHAKAEAYQAIISGRVDEALTQYALFADAEADPARDISAEAFSLLNVFGYHDAALRVGQYRLNLSPGDPVQEYMNACVAGEKLTTAPIGYLEAHFDHLAAEFDARLVTSLGYDGPSIMANLLASHSRRFDHMLDLGCGTGLAADVLHPLGGRLVGVDLSAEMLRQSESRGKYDRLIKAEGVSFLESNPKAFDLIFAADVLIYVGDLAKFFSAAAAAVMEGGYLVASFETTESGRLELRPSGRFAHSRSYIDELSFPFFEIIEWATGTLRSEMRKPIEGAFVLFRARKAADTSMRRNSLPQDMGAGAIR